MIIDCHVHIIATAAGCGSLSPRLRKSLVVRFLRWRLGIPDGEGEVFDRQTEAKLVATIQGAEPLDAAVVLAFDAVYDGDGNLDEANTHLYVSNAYVAQLTQRHPKILFGGSVHPYRKDAILELERCIHQGAVLIKWLPIVQNFNPADERCLPFYEVLAHYHVPLLCHTGGEQALPNLERAWADPLLLIPALKKGVTVIAAHCGTRAHLRDRDYLPAFLKLAHEYENLYGDTAALNLPLRSYAYDSLLSDEVARHKLVHGSDWPIISIPTRRAGWLKAAHWLLAEPNWMRRDILTKQALGFDDAYWQRGGKLLRLPQTGKALLR